MRNFNRYEHVTSEDASSVNTDDVDLFGYRHRYVQFHPKSFTNCTLTCSLIVMFQKSDVQKEFDPLSNIAVRSAFA